MRRIALATLLSLVVSAAALCAPPEAAAPGKGSAMDSIETPDQVLSAALRASVGSPARADINKQVSVRLADDLVLIPREPAARLLAVDKIPVPADFAALLLGPDGMEAPGIIRFVPAGFIDADAALGFSDDDILDSLNDTVQQGNPARVKQGLPPQGARRWIRPPHYDPESHQLSWAALIVSTSAPSEADGTVTYRGIGFGREGYVEVSFVSSVEKADAIGSMIDKFLFGLNFRPGKAYGDAVPADPRAPGGLATAMGIDALHKAASKSSFWESDKTIPATGGAVAIIGAVALARSIRRDFRRKSRRI